MASTVLAAAAVTEPCAAATAGLVVVVLADAGAAAAAGCDCDPSVFSGSVLDDFAGVDAAARMNAGVGIKRGACPGNT